MTNNLRNNMLTSLTSIFNNEIDEIKNKDNIISDTLIYNNELKVDMETILMNAKNDKRFYKLLNLCIKYDIHLFNQLNNNYILLKIEKLLYQTCLKQKNLVNELSLQISNINLNIYNNSLLSTIENIYCQYKKKFKDIDIINYILENIYDDSSLQILCCVNTSNNLSSSSDNANLSSNKTKNKVLPNVLELGKKDKYIAVYSN